MAKTFPLVPSEVDIPVIIPENPWAELILVISSFINAGRSTITCGGEEHSIS